MPHPQAIAELLAQAGAATPEPEPVIAAVEGDTDADVLAGILAKAKGVRETGEKLVEAWFTATWNATKLTKLEAARLGLVASEHNVAAWADLGTRKQRMLTQVRAAAKANAHVAPKVAAATAAKTKARTPEIDAYLLQHADDPAVQQLAHLLGL